MAARHLLLTWLWCTPVLAYDNGMGRTPPMGWNSWCTDSLCNAVGRDPCSEAEVKSTADAIVSQGLDKLGYRYVALVCASSRGPPHPPTDPYPTQTTLPISLPHPSMPSALRPIHAVLYDDCWSAGRSVPHIASHLLPPPDP